MSEWIKTSERLPEQYQHVLIAYKDVLGKLDVCESWMSVGFDECKFYCESGPWFKLDEVIYWMPLPEPPKGE